MRPASVQTITAPASEPITSAEVKSHCRIETDADDTIISLLITAARNHAEICTHRALMPQTLEAQFEEWPDDGEALWLPSPPLRSVTSVKYYDTDGTEQTLSTSVYEVNTATEPGRVALKPNQTWPSLQGGKQTPITIRYVAGYADAASVPAEIKIGMHMLIAWWYKNRETAVIGQTVAKAPYASETLFGHWASMWGY